VVVVRSGGRIIDAGMGAEFPDLPRAGRTVQRLEAAGIDLASVSPISAGCPCAGLSAPANGHPPLIPRGTFRTR
jgi:hypothetical protein